MSPQDQSPSNTDAPMLGVVEGFYGVFYTHPERLDLIRFLGRRGFQRYIYAPKNDRQHRARWFEPYPERILRQFAETVVTAREAGLDFSFGISPGETIEYGSPVDFARLTAKLAPMLEMGVRAFQLLLDDNRPGLTHAADALRYDSLAGAQAHLANRLLAWLRAANPACTLDLVPAEYSGRAPFPAGLHELGRRLDPAIGLYYTGPETCSPEMRAADARAFAEAVCRKPLLWDNYPVNDLAMQPELHIGPLEGREASILDEVQGIFFNPMPQAEASKIPLATAAAWFHDPAGYRPTAAWSAALRDTAGSAYAASLRILAEPAVLSCLGRGGQELDERAEAAMTDLRAGRLEAPAVRALEEALTAIDEATYTLKFRMENLALRNNLLPWIELLEHWMWMARFSLRALRAMRSGQPFEAELHRAQEYRNLIQNHPRQIASRGLLALEAFAASQAAQARRRAAGPPPYHPLKGDAPKGKSLSLPFSFWRQND